MNSTSRGEEKSREGIETAGEIEALIPPEAGRGEEKSREGIETVLS